MQRTNFTLSKSIPLRGTVCPEAEQPTAGAMTATANQVHATCRHCHCTYGRPLCLLLAFAVMPLLFIYFPFSPSFPVYVSVDGVLPASDKCGELNESLYMTISAPVRGLLSFILSTPTRLRTSLLFRYVRCECLRVFFCLISYSRVNYGSPIRACLCLSIFVVIPESCFSMWQTIFCLSLLGPQTRRSDYILGSKFFYTRCHTLLKCTNVHCCVKAPDTCHERVLRRHLPPSAAHSR